VLRVVRVGDQLSDPARLARAWRDSDLDPRVDELERHPDLRRLRRLPKPSRRRRFLGRDRVSQGAPADPGPEREAGEGRRVADAGSGSDPHLDRGKGKARHTREKPARALAYIKLLPTHDVTLESYPKISLDIPRDLASQYRDGEFGIALWNAGEKDAKYRLAVAERDVTSSAPPIVHASTASTAPAPVVSAVATGVPLPVPSPSASGLARLGLGMGGPSTSGAPIPASSATLPPQRLLFAGTATTFHLLANQPAIFALYALPHPAQSAASTAPAAHASSAVVSAIPSALPSPAASSMPATVPSGSPAPAAPHR
jgi:hypothetical protein